MTEPQMQAVIIDDDPEVLESLEQWLTLADIEVRTFADANSALPDLTPDFPGVVVSDIRMPGMDGMNLLQSIDPGIPVILITGHGGIAQAVEAMKLGAFDFIEKPYKPDRLVELIKRAWQQRRVSLATAPRVAQHDDEQDLASVLIGHSKAMSALRDQILALARVNADVIIMGETGNRQGTGRPQPPRLQHSPRPAVHGHQRRRHSGKPARKRALRPRSRRLHRRPQTPDRHF